MSVIANIGINLDAAKALASLNQLSQKANQTAQTVGGKFEAVGGKIASFGQKFQSVGGVLASLGTTAVVGGLAKAGMSAQAVDTQIKALAGSSEEAARIFAVADQAATQFGLGQTSAAKGVADLYGRLAPTGIALEDIKTVFFGVNNAANTMGLSMAEADGVMLQLSQALGSGSFQGDELRSVMEQLPAVGQAVAKVMGVTVGEVKQLGADGKITTDVMIKAAKELENMTKVDPTPMKVFQAAMADLQTELGENLIPLITPLIKGLTSVVKAFSSLPEPLQTVIVAVGALAAAFVVIAPIISTVGTAIATLGPIITGVVAFLTGGSGMAAALTAVITILSGPVGWIAAIIAAGVAIWTFRDEIAAFFTWAFEAYKEYATYAYKFFVEPYVKNFEFVVAKAKEIMPGIGDAIMGAFDGVTDFVKGVVNGMLGAFESLANGAIKALNGVIRTANLLPGVSIPYAPTVSIPRMAEGGYATAKGIAQFAKGGLVNKGTLAVVGEAGPEYIIPEGKMLQASMNYLNGMRGAGVIPQFANGGVVGAPQINIKTGPVMQQGNERYVTIGDLEAAMRDTADSIIGQLRSPSTRFGLGIG